MPGSWRFANVPEPCFPLWGTVNTPFVLMQQCRGGTAIGAHYNMAKFSPRWASQE